MVLILGLIVLVTASILGLALSSRQPSVAYGPGRWAIALVSPFQKMVVRVKQFTIDIWDHYFFLVSVAEDNERLMNQLLTAKALNNECRETQLANKRLLALLNLQQAMQRPLIAAQVVGKDPSPWFQSMMVDKGKSDGVVKGLPVLNPEGIVGLVIETTNHYSKVMLITDPNSAVDAIVQKSRARGIIKGGTVGYCVFNYVLRKHDVETGDTVVTSGMDGVFPKGLPVGKVAEIVKYEAGIFQDMRVTPFVDFERLEEVFIIPTSNSTSPS